MNSGSKLLLFMNLISISINQGTLGPQKWASYYSKALQGTFIRYSIGEWFTASLNDCVLTATDKTADGYSYVPPPHNKYLSAKAATHVVGKCTMLTKSANFTTYRFNEETWSYAMYYSMDPEATCPAYQPPDFVGLKIVKEKGMNALVTETLKGRSQFCLATKVLPAHCVGIPLRLNKGNTFLSFINSSADVPENTLTCSMKRLQCGADVTIHERRNAIGEYFYSHVPSADSKIKCYGWNKEAC